MEPTKHRFFLLASINLCCLVLLWVGQYHLQNARAYLHASAPVLIEAVYYDAYGYQDADEAVALRNPGTETIDISGWHLTDVQNKAVEIPEGTRLLPHSLVWLTGDGPVFQRQFGRPADVVLGSWPGFANDGDEVQLLDEHDFVVDTVVYGDGEIATEGWLGPALQPYSVSGVFSREGQVLYRKPDQISGLPLPDNDRATDWAQDRSDPISGNRVRYPGWDLETFAIPARVQQSSTLTISIAPDNAYETLVKTIRNARASIKITTHTLENLAIGDELSVAAERGVTISILLEGDPVGGISAHEKALCHKVESSGGQCWFMISDSEQRIYDRYRYVHAKYMIVDDRLAVISSENLSPNSMPYDDKSDGTWGRRGVILLTDAPGIVQALNTLYEHDLDPTWHNDLFRWRSDHPKYGLPSSSYVPIQNSGGTTYTVRYPQAVVFHDVNTLELQQAPENLLRTEDGILGLINHAGVGDTVLVQQLQERPHWGNSASNRLSDPNLRLEAVLEAARRGATVRLMLDKFFDKASSPLSNAATCLMVNELARREGLRLECLRVNPTGLGIHNKMILAHIDGHGYVHVGSWNGSELASKGNREVALLVQSDSSYTYLADMFERDWPHRSYYPVLVANYVGFPNHVLISEIVYDPSGSDDSEFIELVNPSFTAVNLSDFALGDAVNREDFEDVRRFPDGAILNSGEIIVVATSAVAHFEEYGLWPDYEILETSALVPNLIDDPDWGDPEALLRLGNHGDEIILRDHSDNVVDVLTYGDGIFPNHHACPLLMSTGHSLERYPYWHDTNDCLVDFRDWPFPSPGSKP